MVHSKDRLMILTEMILGIRKEYNFRCDVGSQVSDEDHSTFIARCVFLVGRV